MDFRERERQREREREGNINVKENNKLVASHRHHDRESNLQPFDVGDNAPAN